jgi:hypothetical protein
MSTHPVRAVASRVKAWALGSPSPYGAVPVTVAGAAFAGSINASGNSDDFDIGEVSTGLLSASVGSPTGTTPSITVSLQVKDVMGNYINAVTLGALTAQGVQSASVGPGTANQVVLTSVARFAWTVTGTTPNFPGVTIALSGR